MIDQDRAEASFGIFPERSLTGNAFFSQAVYDERLWANRSIEKALQESRVQDLETLISDGPLPSRSPRIQQVAESVRP